MRGQNSKTGRGRDSKWTARINSAIYNNNNNNNNLTTLYSLSLSLLSSLSTLFLIRGGCWLLLLWCSYKRDFFEWGARNFWGKCATTLPYSSLRRGKRVDSGDNGDNPLLPFDLRCPVGLDRWPSVPGQLWTPPERAKLWVRCLIRG